MVELFNEIQEKASYWEVLEWIVQKYPEDIFVLENPMFLEIRDRARLLLSQNPENKPKEKKKEYEKFL